MAHRAVKIYDHKKRKDGSWTFVPMAIGLDTRSNKTVKGNFKISWYDGSKKQFSKGHFTDLQEPSVLARPNSYSYMMEMATSR